MPTYYFLNLWEDWDLRYDVIFQEAFPENSSKTFTWTEALANRYLRPDLIGKQIEVGDTALYFTKKSLTDDFKKAGHMQPSTLMTFLKQRMSMPTEEHRSATTRQTRQPQHSTSQVHSRAL